MVAGLKLACTFDRVLQLPVCNVISNFWSITTFVQLSTVAELNNMAP